MEILFRTDSLETFTAVAEEMLDNLYIAKAPTKITSVEPHNVQSSKEEFKSIVTNCDFDVTKIAEIIKAKGWEQTKVDIFISLLEKKKSEILYAALIQSNSANGETVLDFDWLLKLVCGADKLKTLRYPVFQLILSTVNPSGVCRQRVYDVNKEMLAKLINVLESSIN